MVGAVLSNSAQFGINFVPAILDDDDEYVQRGNENYEEMQRKEEE